MGPAIIIAMVVVYIAATSWLSVRSQQDHRRIHGGRARRPGW
jgi:hypothetical protein